MMSLFEATWVVARRDFTATVFSRTFILFLLAPVVLFAIGIWAGQTAGDADREASRPVVALVADSETVRALEAARQELASGLGEETLPELETVAPAENVSAQARRLIADRESGYTAVLSGTIDAPTLTGPSQLENGVGRRIALLLEQARRLRALEGAGNMPPPLALERVVTDDAAGTMRLARHVMARLAQTLIFFITLMLSTVLLSNLVEEKSNKVIEVLAAAIPLDAVFLGKMLAMLAISLVGLALWGGLLALAFLFVQVVQDFVTLPSIAPGVGWPLFFLLIILYYTANYMLLGALFLGIGGQASSFREVQTLSMPVTLMQLLIFLLATSVIGAEGGWLAWTAYIFPLSSPMAMAALAAQSDMLWPHLLALLWQAAWVVLIIRLSAAMFRKTVLKSGGKTGIIPKLKFRKA